jgi:hypothetical protein
MNDSAHSPTANSPDAAPRNTHFTLAALALALGNGVLWYNASETSADALLPFTLAAISQLVLAMLGLVASFRRLAQDRGGVGILLLSVLLTLEAPISWFLGAFSMLLSSLPDLPLSGGH